MKKLAFLFFMLFTLALTSHVAAQDYKSAIGLRFGSPFAASYKFFVSEPGAIEGYLGFSSYSGGYGGFNIGAMYQYHLPINGVDGLNWYFGGGASINFFTCTGCSAATSFGINGVIGLDYAFADAPLNLSVDFSPTFFVNTFANNEAYKSYGALSARYILN